MSSIRYILKTEYTIYTEYSVYLRYRKIDTVTVPKITVYRETDIFSSFICTVSLVFSVSFLIPKHVCANWVMGNGATMFG